ncbi:hypothetical protein EV201_3362 [Ancylomarina subtilis]|uniref:Uncharacterized protein n=1 Tax=Ancylomarina subtilis TaxID=1639035 RepID=A0A4Q7V8Q4_9BACT|nr:hypothetical protein [Ancylomarina subtilis]RZT91032.1 hypothetical protein EV201_3362 [Ancylomarina subtilis]
MEELGKKIPTISAFLLTAGFVNSYSYYTHFQINIFTYLTTGELILSFLPVIIPIFIAIVFILYHAFREGDKFENNIKNNTFLENKDLTFWGPFKDLLKLMKSKFRTSENKWKLLYHYVSQILARILLLTIFLGLTSYFVYSFIKRQGFPSEEPIPFFILSAIWLIIIAFKMQKYFQKRVPDISDFMTQSVVVIGFLSIIFLFNSFRAFSILENKPSYEIEIIQKNLKMKSDSNIVYIGKTKEYIFLRNLEEEKNLIIDNRNTEMIFLKPIEK